MMLSVEWSIPTQSVGTRKANLFNRRFDCIVSGFALPKVRELPGRFVTVHSLSNFGCCSNDCDDINRTHPMQRVSVVRPIHAIASNSEPARVSGRSNRKNRNTETKQWLAATGTNIKVRRDRIELLPLTRADSLKNILARTQIDRQDAYNRSK
jgi:hypothetical protein